MSSTPPQAVVFDLGKVLLDFDYSIAIGRLAGRTETSPEAIRKHLNESSLLVDYETGRLSTAEFFESIRAVSGFDGRLDEFTDIFADIFTEISPMLALHAEVRSVGIPTYVLSNTNDLAIRFVRERYAFYSQFDGYVLSYEHGLMKPESGLYEAVEKLAKLRGAELFYLDDMPVNVEAALRRGWRAIVHRDPEESRFALVQAGMIEAR